ncbi:GON-4-like protein isoform X2 [Cherax quadricarinatus]|uniref:GON-4-like protein isoform X2 n=1 Tax=Cherax quadricarinatus TaxID=27406 RepID=UPI0023792DBF|nr:uncharacterized protein LOC128693692 isoform X2 [Cherax quadricarinatus]
MAETNEDSVEILKELQKEAKENEKGKEEHLKTNKTSTENKFLGKHEPDSDESKEALSKGINFEEDESVLVESKNPPDKSAELSSNKLCDNTSEALKKLQFHGKTQTATLKNINVISKTYFRDEDDKGHIEMSDIEKASSLEMQNEELSKLSDKKEIHDKTIGKHILMQSNECDNQVEIKEVKNENVFDGLQISEEKCKSTANIPQGDDNNSDTSKKECEEKEDYLETEGEEEDSEDSPSHTAKETETTETETEDSDHDFPTEGLLKELHFLNASCERPLSKKNSLQQIHKTPKKQRKLDFDSPPDSSSSVTSGKVVYKRLSSRKRTKTCAPSSGKTFQQVTGDEEESDEDDEGSLTIVAQEDKRKKRKGVISPPRSKKKVRGENEDVPQEVIELIQSGIDEVLEEKAERTHLTAIHVKNIIKNVMTDENVLAMVRNTILGIHGEGSETSAVYEPTLTRAKTKELMEQQAAGVGSGNIWAGLSNSSSCGTTSLNPETRALVTTDFPEEDEDEEYRPEVDELLPSDDESLVSTSFGSEVGSPTTPCTPSATNVSSTTVPLHSLNTPPSSRMSTPKNQRLMALKTPNVQKKSVQRILDFEEAPCKEEVVSQRTRSKLPLTETPLECLEMAFKPPDVTKDMYETEVDNDDWKTFLIDFIHPLKNTEAGEDEEADPEYNILEDKEDALDLKEEMRGDRAVQISKKEINELMIELFDTLGNNEGTESLRMHLSQLSGQKEIKKSTGKTNSMGQASENKDGPSPGTIWVEALTAEFTKTQLQILQCQMVQHVQLLATSSLICYGTSLLDHVANGCLDHLETLKKTADESDFKQTFFHPFNLDPAIETLKNFKIKTANSVTSDTQLKTCTTELNPVVIEAILESLAFPYPRLLPTRMFQHPNTRGFSKTIFVPSEDMLIALGLERYLDSKYRQEKCKKNQYRHLLEALSLTVQNILVGKTLSQATTRVKNIRYRTNEAPNNPILQYFETGKVDLTPAEVEASLPCVPCPVQNFPESSLKKPYQSIIQKRNATLKLALQEISLKAAQAFDTREREAKYRGALTLKKPIQNIVIIQSSGCSNRLPLTPDTVQPFTTYSHIVNPSVVYHPPPPPPPPPPVNIPKIHVVRMQDLESSVCKAQSSSFNQSGSSVNLGTQATSADTLKQDCSSNQSCEEIMRENEINLSADSLPSNPGSNLMSSNDGESGIMSVDRSRYEESGRGDTAREIKSPPMKTSKLNCEPSKAILELNESSDKNGNSIKCITQDSQNHSYAQVNTDNRDRKGDINLKQKRKCNEDADDSITSDTESLPDLIGKPKENEKIGKIKMKNDEQFIGISSVGTVDKGELDIHRPPPRTHSDIPVDIPSLSTTPNKSNDVSLSPLDTPATIIPPNKSHDAPVKVIGHVKQTDLSSVAKKDEIKLVNRSSHGSHLEPVASIASRVMPLCIARFSSEKSVPLSDKGTGLNAKESQSDFCKRTSLENKNVVVQNPVVQNANWTPELMSAVTQNQASTQSTSITLVTSVYQSPIFSSEVDKASPLNLIHISPQKTKATYRRISPAKSFRAPIKTSPLKQVSPILRKYHKYSPKKRRLRSEKKLSPILPKVSHRSNSSQRRLAPRPSKMSSAFPESTRGRHCRRGTGTESFLHGRKHRGDGELLQLDDELMESNVSVSAGATMNVPQPVTQAHQPEEDFEEYSLEDEDEEDEDEEDEDEEEEEEDSEAAQQREEHLAALLKASSTITLRRGGGGDGFDKRLNAVGDVGQGERKLTKQQRRLQARITALSYVPDTVSQDKFMAQSYLMRVREALVAKDPAAFKEFLCILNKFTETPGQSPLQLHNQLSEVLKDFPQLMEEFVSFLLPQQAMILGKYAQYCAIHRMRDFLEKLELQFCKQPKYIQKIIRLLQSMQNDSNLNIEEVKAAITPLLKYPHLVECFTQCFPSQSPPPSLQSDFEDVLLENPGTPDSMESLILPDDDSHTSPNHCVCPCHASVTSVLTSISVTQHTTANSAHHNHCRSCALRFSEGRIYLQCGKTLRPAKVTYQTDTKKEEPGEKNSQGQACGGNIHTVTDNSDTFVKVKSVTKGKISHLKDPGDGVNTRNKENANKIMSSSNSTNSTTHVNNTSLLKGRIDTSSEEYFAKDDSSIQTEKPNIFVKIRGENVETVKEPLNSKNFENLGSKNEGLLDGKTPCTKKTISNRSYEKTEVNTCSDTTLAKSSSYIRTSLSQANMKSLKGKVISDSASNSSCSFRNKDFPFLPCSPPKDVHNENTVLPSSSKTNNLHNFGTIGSLAQNANIMDERNRPIASAVIVTDKGELQKEHKAAFCHLPLQKLSQCQITETRQSLKTNVVNEGVVSVYSAGGAQSFCSPYTFLQHCSSSSESTTYSSESQGRSLGSQSTSNKETKKIIRNLTDDLDSSPGKSLLSSVNTSSTPVLPTALTFKSVNWTKEEDRTILTIVQQKGATDAVFQEIAGALPSRNYHEVFERFNVLVRLMLDETDIEDCMSISSEDSTI